MKLIKNPSSYLYGLSKQYHRIPFQRKNLQVRCL
jgi:hypothetical protein